jgi:DNA cross-link repair 1A protein
VYSQNLYDWKRTHDQRFCLLFVKLTWSTSDSTTLLAIAQVLHTKVYCDERKAAILRCQNDAELQAMLTCDPYDADVHIVPLRVLTRDRLQAYADGFEGAFSNVVGFRPTGWTLVPFTSDELASANGLTGIGNGLM